MCTLPGDGYMEQILDFIVRHWQLSGLLSLLITAYAVFEWRQGGDSSQVTAEQAIDLYNHHDAVLLDIRSSDAFKAGHIVGSTHVEEPESKLTRFNKYAQKPVIIISVDGKNTNKFATGLAQQGLTKVLTLTGGINAWQSTGLPLTKPS